ncbi:probable protein S-acyltransferase 12 isoform X2 [Phalaenopsis equestris]|uniref:probable protein S-acyltransferase 12 isoform X2 n=1 Tax=Phalaenopsis equestris TaxID=78828 RepID=UPI0009E58603|nr:probable protein S-acyltransferase 12 isoform X2 [Phalaenopsis equestris]
MILSPWQITLPVLPGSQNFHLQRDLAEGQTYVTVVIVKTTSLHAAIIVLFVRNVCLRWIIIAYGLSTVLFYTFLETVLDSLALLPHFIKFFGEARNHSGSPGNLAVTFLSFVLNVAFALSLLCFVIMHTSLVLSNTTTIEVYEKKNVVEWKYDLGKRKNFEQVFGSNKLFWFFPMFSKNDLHDVPALHGLDFPIRSGFEV